jgi:hypothetical protein
VSCTENTFSIYNSINVVDFRHFKAQVRVEVLYNLDEFISELENILGFNSSIAILWRYIVTLQYYKPSTLTSYCSGVSHEFSCLPLSVIICNCIILILNIVAVNGLPGNTNLIVIIMGIYWIMKTVMESWQDTGRLWISCGITVICSIFTFHFNGI